MQLSNFEKTIIVLILIVGLAGGVLLAYLQEPPIISSIFIAMAIATLVYHFLGGIKSAEVNTGVVKLGGSIAALIGSAIIINNVLAHQMINAEKELKINSRYELIDAKNKTFGKLPVSKYQISLNKELGVSFNDSIQLGKIGLGSLEINESYEVVAALNEINLGKLNKENLLKIGMFNDLELVNYTEIKYLVQLQAPFTAIVDSEFWGNNWEYRNKYNQLPFKIEPKFHNGSDQTEVIFKGSTSYHPVENGKIIALRDSRDNLSVIYLIRIRQLVRNRDKSTFENFVQYHIFELQGKM